MKDDVIKIVISGGSNSGKTEIIQKLVDFYNDKYIVAVVPETATELLNEGVKPNKRFQKKVAQRQLENEEETFDDTKWYKKLCEFEHTQHEGIIILYDRSFMDQLAYCSKDDWQAYMREVLGTTSFDESVEGLNDRYDIVIHLQTNAEFKHVSEGRLETQEEAIELEKRTLRANQYFRDLYYVERQDNIKDKFNEVVDIIDYELRERGMK